MTDAAFQKLSKNLEKCVINGLSCSNPSVNSCLPHNAANELVCTVSVEPSGNCFSEEIVSEVFLI